MISYENNDILLVQSYPLTCCNVMRRKTAVNDRLDIELSDVI